MRHGNNTAVGLAVCELLKWHGHQAGEEAGSLRNWAANQSKCTLFLFNAEVRW